MYFNERYRDSITKQVVEFVQQYPGCTRADILTVLPKDTKRSSVSSIITYLRKASVIENHGGKGLAARWHPLITEVDPYFSVVADDLMAELAKVHKTQRNQYLAKRLEEIFG